MSRVGTSFSESDIARPVVAWLKDHHWTVYQEVAYGGRCADIVATLGTGSKPLVMVVEVKKSLGLDVIEQACFWTSRAHYVCVATPRARSRSTQLLNKILDWQGLGLLEIDTGRLKYQTNLSVLDVSQRVAPPLHRKSKTKKLLGVLTEDHKTYAEAGNGSKHWTPFLATCRTLLQTVTANPGITLKAFLDTEKTHYASKSSARANIVRWIEAGVIPGLRLVKTGKAIQLHLI